MLKLRGNRAKNFGHNVRILKFDLTFQKNPIASVTHFKVEEQPVLYPIHTRRDILLKKFKLLA